MSNEIIFLVEEDIEGGFSASAVGYGIITQGDNLDELKLMIKDAVECHFDDEEEKPSLIRLHFIKEVIFAL